MTSSNLEKILDQFNEHAMRPILLAGKEKLDQSYPTSFLKQSVDDVYALIAGADLTADMIDPAKIVEAVDSLKLLLKDPAVSLQIAQDVKSFLAQNSNDSLKETFIAASKSASPEQQFVLQILMAQIMPKINELRDASVSDIALQVNTFADSLSGEDIAARLTAVLPEIASRQKEEALKQLPPSETVVEILDGLRSAAGAALETAAKGASFADTIRALKQFPENANAILARVPGPSGPDASGTPKPVQPKKPSFKKGKGWRI